MNEKEVMQWAIKGIEADLKKQTKLLKRDIQILNDNKSNLKVKKRIAERREKIELLGQKKAFLIVRLEDS